MKYLITEKQKKILSEDPLVWFKRRATIENLKPWIEKTKLQFPLTCEDYRDEFDYSDLIIKWAIDDFLLSKEDIFFEENYDEVYSMFVNFCEKWFKESLIEDYRNACSK